ncbi:unnamed protein product [Symbiodinium sp. KB8]|nr:unnamed protein product [Symbiodinium sp. KB8]
MCKHNKSTGNDGISYEALQMLLQSELAEHVLDMYNGVLQGPEWLFANGAADRDGWKRFSIDWGQRNEATTTKFYSQPPEEVDLKGCQLVQNGDFFTLLHTRHPPVEEPFATSFVCLTTAPCEAQTEGNFENVLRVFSDGSAPNNRRGQAGVGGAAVVMLSPYALVEQATVCYFQVPQPCTNIQAELQAAAQALRMIRQIRRAHIRVPITYHTDSQYVLQNLEGSFQGTHYASVTNEVIDLWNELCLTVDCKHVRAHKGILLNEIADSFAKDVREHVQAFMDSARPVAVIPSGTMLLTAVIGLGVLVLFGWGALTSFLRSLVTAMQGSIREHLAELLRDLAEQTKKSLLLEIQAATEEMQHSLTTRMEHTTEALSSRLNEVQAAVAKLAAAPHDGPSSATLAEELWDSLRPVLVQWTQVQGDKNLKILQDWIDGLTSAPATTTSAPLSTEALEDKMKDLHATVMTQLQAESQASYVTEDHAILVRVRDRVDEVSKECQSHRSAVLAEIKNHSPIIRDTQKVATRAAEMSERTSVLLGKGDPSSWETELRHVCEDTAKTLLWVSGQENELKDRTHKIESMLTGMVDMVTDVGTALERHSESIGSASEGAPRRLGQGAGYTRCSKSYAGSSTATPLRAAQLLWSATGAPGARAYPDDRGGVPYTMLGTRWPATSSPLSAASEPTWVPRIPAVAPTGVVLSDATETSLLVSWTSSPLKDCVFQRFAVELSNGSDFVVPGGCDITDVATTNCVATGLQSWTAYTARVAVLCDECSETPTAERVPCSEEDGPGQRCFVPATGGLTSCFRKLPALRASSSFSAPSLSSSTLPRIEATPVLGTVQVPADSGQRVTFAWASGVGSEGNPNVTSDCIFQSWRLEIQVQSESVWAKPDGCLSLIDPMATTCTAINLQCDTAYNARIRKLCDAGASSDWMAFPAFRTAYAGNCLRTASAPLLLRNTSRTATSLTVAFIAGSAGDCIFDRFELQYQEPGSTWIAVPAGCGSLDVRLGPSCTIPNLAQDTAYYFRVRELCTNGAPLASPWGLTEDPLRTDFVPMVNAPTYLEPDGFISPAAAPTRLIVVFEVDLQLGTEGARLSLCPTFLPIATPEDPGICGCGTAEDCAAQCLTEATMTVELVSPHVLIADFGSLLRPRTGCPYVAVMEAGFLETQLAPSNPSPRTEWSFIYWPPAPTGTLTMFSSTTTSLTVRVSWSIPMTTTCGVLVGSSTMQQTDPLDFTGSREFLEVRIIGLVPFTQYTVTCTGVAIGDTVVTASVSKSGLSTEPDTNDRLSDIVVTIQAVCNIFAAVNASGTNESVANVSQVLVPVEAALLPVFDPTLRQYQLILDAEDARDFCGTSESEAVFRPLSSPAGLRGLGEKPFED